VLGERPGYPNQFFSTIGQKGSNIMLIIVSIHLAILSLIFPLHLLHGSQTIPYLFLTLVMWFLNHDPLEVIQPCYVINV